MLKVLTALGDRDTSAWRPQLIKGGVRVST
jgi:hypothetical protein